MTREEETYYEHYFDMFSTAGWKQFAEEAKVTLDSHRIEAIADEASLNYLKGERNLLNRIATFEDTVRNAYEEIQASYD